MNRSLPTFNEAQDRVKISWFTKQGYDITGLVHVGANDGYEIEFYLKMGIKPVLAFEPLATARKIMFQKYKDNPDVVLSDMALGNIEGGFYLNVAPDDGKDSSFFDKARATVKTHGVPAAMTRWASLIDIYGRSDRYNCCVIDVQGMELDVLRGMDDYVSQFDFLSVECSKTPIYKGEASVYEVVSYLTRKGFTCQTVPFPEHDDVFFVNNRVLRPPAPEKPVPNGDKLNIGSGQRRFEGNGWINVDAVSRPGQVPDLILDAGKEPLPYPDNSMSHVVLHQVYEHFGCGEGHSLIKECHRVLTSGGKLIVTVPDMAALADAWKEHQIDDYIYMVNVYGAYQGEDGDRHKWGYCASGLVEDLRGTAPWFSVYALSANSGYRLSIPGADIARDWWILEVEATK